MRDAPRLFFFLNADGLQEIKSANLTDFHKKVTIFASVNNIDMIVTFEKDYLRELYETGKGDKKHRFQPDIVKRYRKRIDTLRRALNVEELFTVHALNYEVLKGDKAGISSIRVNDQYRIEFTVSNQESETIVYICNILELSNHYK